MKFSQLPYTRPDYQNVFQELDALTQKVQDAPGAKEQAALYRQAEELLSHVSTQATLRKTIQTKRLTFNEYKDFYQQLDAAEGCTGAGGSITVDITGENGFTASIPAALYGGEDLRAYVRAEGGVGP